MKFNHSYTRTNCSAASSFVGTYSRDIGNGSTCPSIFKTNSASTLAFCKPASMDNNENNPITLHLNEHLQQWLRELNSSERFQLENRCPSGTLRTDASLENWGAYLWFHVTQGNVGSVSSDCLNCLVLAVQNVLKHFNRVFQLKW